MKSPSPKTRPLPGKLPHSSCFHRYHFMVQLCSNSSLHESYTYLLFQIFNMRSYVFYLKSTEHLVMQYILDMRVLFLRDNGLNTLFHPTPKVSQAISFLRNGASALSDNQTACLLFTLEAIYITQRRRQSGPGSSFDIFIAILIRSI